MKNKENIIPPVILIQIVILMAITTLFISCGNRNEIKGAGITEVTAKKQYVCSMHPQIIQDTPGDCPICGMFLIEKIADDDNSSDSLLNNVIHNVNEAVISSVSRIKPVRAPLPVSIETSGFVTYDSRKIKTISARTNGVIEKSFIKYQFQPVTKGQKIYQVYCPDIYIDKWNYVLQIKAFPDQENLTVEAREWFKLLGLTKGQLDSLVKAEKPDYHLLVYSDYTGNLVNPDFDPDTYYLQENGNGEVRSPDQRIGLYDGVTIEKGASLFKVVDPAFLRVDLKVSTEDVRLLKAGHKVKITDVGTGEEMFSGTISQIEPFNGGLFQIVRIYLSDGNKSLQPGRQIRGQISSGEYEALWLPESAVIDLGHETSVFRFSDGKFIATPIATGVRINGLVEILSGIDPSSEVAINGLMLIDSDGFITSR